MTTEPTPPTRVKVEPNTRLEQLFAMYSGLKAESDEAAAKLKTVTDAIKVELTALAPGAQKIGADASHLGLALELSYVESWRVDAKALKAGDPVTYVTWARKSGSWVLKRAVQ